MTKIRFVHWKQEEAEDKAQLLTKLGFSVDWHLPRGTDFLQKLRKQQPAAIVISLERLPAQGRDLGLAIRHQKTTRFIPLIFIGGKPEKIQCVRSVLGDAIFTTWDDIEQDLKRAFENPIENPIVPESVFDAYRDKPLAAKLGIKPNMRVALVDQPDGFGDLLGDLPQDCSLDGSLDGNARLIIWFVTSIKVLQNRIEDMALCVGQGAMWIAWPKKTAKHKSDLTQNEVRRIGLASGLVDYKICSFDKTWSGLLFTCRKKQ